MVFSKWHLVLLATVILVLSLFQFMRFQSYDVDDVLHYVSSTIKQDGQKAGEAVHAIHSSITTHAVPATLTITQDPVTRTVTHTETAPTVTETVTVEKDKEDEGQSHDPVIYFDQIKVMNTSISLPAHPIHFDPKGPRPDQIILLTATDGAGHNNDIENIVEMTTGNRKSYCDQHGYIYSFINISKYNLDDAPAVWKKLPAIVEAFNDHPDAQWLFWLDLDAIIMSPQQDLQSLILSHDGMRKNFEPGAELGNGGEGNFWPQEPDFENIDFIIAQDHNGPNAGSFFLRRTQFTQTLLDFWADPFFLHANFERQEQDAVVHLLKHHRTVRDHTGIANLRAINAFSDGPPSMKWGDGDLLVHLAGCWVTDACAERWENFWEQRGQLKKRTTR